MGIRKYAVVSVILLILTLFALPVNAEEEKAYYLVTGTYNADELTYTVDVYLNTRVYLAAGTFGMKYGEGVPVPDSGLTINTTDFIKLDAKPFDEQKETFRENRQIVLQWALNTEDVTDWTTFKLGSFTIENITPEEAKNWGDTPFELLNWLTTDLSRTTAFTQTDADYNVPLNREIWRETTEAERTNGAPPGYYQGQAYDENDWVDIGFKFQSNLTIKISGVINAYNPKNDPVIYAYKGDTEVFEGEIKERVFYPDGRVTYKYEVEADDTGGYTMVIQKSVHLTYTEEINIPYDVADEYAMPHEITLVCGDINSDGYIKIPDRSHLIEMLHHPSRNALNTTEFDLCDLNGDSRINLSDLNILKSNINRTYS